MTAPDPTYARMYHALLVGRHAAIASRRIEELTEGAQILANRLAKKPDGLYAHDAEQLVEVAVELTRALAAVEAVREVEFLNIDPDAEV
jgi:hypothetical protein